MQRWDTWSVQQQLFGMLNSPYMHMHSTCLGGLPTNTYTAEVTHNNRATEQEVFTWQLATSQSSTIPYFGKLDDRTSSDCSAYIPFGEAITPPPPPPQPNPSTEVQQHKNCVRLPTTGGWWWSLYCAKINSWQAKVLILLTALQITSFPWLTKLAE